jgi:glycosyltransferase involved in cell wall biosynthesis
MGEVIGPLRPADKTEVWAHVNTIFSVHNNPINRVIREISREAAQAGISSWVAASNRRECDFGVAGQIPVDYCRYLEREYMLPRELWIDAALARLGVSRRYMARRVRPAAEALAASGFGFTAAFVHDGYYGMYVAGAVASAIPRVPTFVYVHNSLSRSYTRREKIAVLEQVAAVICVSEYMREEVASSLRLPRFEDKLKAVLNGVDTDTFYPAAERPEGPIRIAFAGRMIPEKGPLLLAKALLAIRDLPFEAGFVGSSGFVPGEALSAYEREVRKSLSSISEKVVFRGLVKSEDMPDEYRRYDILVAPSVMEDPCSLVILEAMASGLAVVCSGRGGMREEGGDAVLYASEPKGLAEVLSELIRNDSLRQELGRRARKRAETLTWRRTFNQLSELVRATS